MNQKSTIMERGIKLWYRLPPSWRFSLVSVTLMRAFYTLWSLVFLSSFSLIVQNQDILGKPLVTVFDLQTSRSYVYSRLYEKDLLYFQKYDAAHIVDTKQVVFGKFLRVRVFLDSIRADLFHPPMLQRKNCSLITAWHLIPLH